MITLSTTSGSPAESSIPPATPLDGLGHSVPRGVKNPLSERIPVRLSQARWRQELSAAVLSIRAGLNRNAVGVIEDSIAVARINTIERVAAALGVTPGWLAFGHEGYETFRQRRPRDPVPRDDPDPDEQWMVYRGRCDGVAQRLRQSREKSGLSMRELSRAAGVSVQTWSNVEHGKGCPRVDIVERMAVALEVPAAWLAYGYDEDVTEGATTAPPAARS